MAIRIQDIIEVLEQFAPPVLQEDFDNAGLLVGEADRPCTGVLCTLDATEAVIEEAAAAGCNLVVTYHPIIFKGLRRITGDSYVERAVIAAIRKNVAIYSIHTNLDNIRDGMNGQIASMLSLVGLEPLVAKKGLLRKLFVFVPVAHADGVRNAIFAAGGGHIGHYSACSFNAEGTGTYQAGEGAHPFVGRVGELHREPEVKVEVIFPAYLETKILKAMRQAHPYEEVAYDLVALENSYSGVGSGWIGTLPEPLEERAFLERLQKVFHLSVIRHSPLLSRPVSRVAVCGGSGSFLTGAALAADADWLVTADIRYHEFFGADNRIVLADIGHYESEQFTINLLLGILRGKFSTFALLHTKVRTNPVHYFI
jgi:dinuclear metal center YbgI/SA1388 family protein